jgi:hypothetical protein
MTDAVKTKFATFDLLKALDVIFGGQHHETFARIAEGLGLQLPVMAPPPDQGSDSEDEAAGEVPDRICDFLAAQTEPVGLAQIVAGLNANRWSINSALHRLLKKGSVEHVGRDAWKIAAPVEP